MTDSLLNIGFTQLWQLSLLILVVGLLARTLCRNRPHAAMVLWLLVLVKCVTPPVVEAPFGLFCRTIEPEIETIAPVEEASPFAFFVKQEPVPPVAVEILTYPEPIEMSVPIEEPIEPLTTRDWLVIGWAIGTALVVLIAFIRVVLCLHRIKRTSVEPPAELVERLEELRSKLGIRRRVSLMITSSAIGPAVIGLFRLRIVVPEVIARDGADKLEPILAHELIHIRRGDLWVGLLNLIAKGLWWFHPLMWWVSKQISRDTERACDEDVLTALECRPAEYARSLLRVLEQKNELKAMPAFPGVRPVEITSQRMERIMSLRQGSRSGGSWRRRLLFVVAAAVVLPGAVISQDAKPVPKAKKANPPAKQVMIEATIIKAPKGVFTAVFPEVREWKKTPVQREVAESAGAPVGFGFSIEPNNGGFESRYESSWSLGVMLPTPPEILANQKQSETTELLTKAKWQTVLEVLKEREDVEVLCTPRLMCRNAQQASCETAGTDRIR
ncbi:MAG: M56 family metallopeptidase, partial [Planctomycetaceae bacterium]